MAVFTVLLPVVRPPALLPLAVRSVLGQDFKDFELFIVCDGAPRETVECANALAEADRRIRVFPFEKGQRNGEAHRHAALEQASGQLVAQIADDDLWFPNHLIEIGRLLQRYHFGNLPQPLILADQNIRVVFGLLQDRVVRRRMLEQAWNIFGPSFAGYRMDAYRGLEVGWSPAPPELPSDLFMWRKFLAAPGVSCGTRIAVTGAHLASQERTDRTLEDRAREMAELADRASDNRFRDWFAQRVLIAITREAAKTEAAMEAAHIGAELAAG